MDEEPQQGRGWWFVEMYALGAILHGYDVMTSAGFQASLGWWIAGGIVALAGWHWARLKPLLGLNEEKVRRVTGDFRWWVVSILILFVLPLIPRLVDSYLIIYSRLNDPPSHILELTDAKRWRLITTFKELTSAKNGNHPACSAAAKVKDSKSAGLLADELYSVISFAMWENYGGGPTGQEIYSKGLTILVSSARSDSIALRCATKLNTWINENTPIHSRIVEDQATPALRQCKEQNYDCMEIHIGDAE
jgi:hypothetical protein